jgi:alcohol/geraniol dehydrogenase (NADP+)
MSTAAASQKQSSVSAFAAFNAGGTLQPWTYEPGPLAEHEVDIKVSHCGVCHTDAHLVDNDFGISRFPLVPGHEAVGTVTDVGSAVRQLAPGQRVGVGWQRGTCNECEWCVQDLQNLCAQSRPTCLAGYGGFAQSLRVDARFAVPIPEALDSSVAAPMFCAGITVYSPLRRFAKAGSRVGVIGIGGLGHLALQFARALGTEVYAISTNPEKQEEAIQFGAHHFIVSKEPEQMKRLTGALDLLLTTATANLDWGAWLATLRPNGTFCLLGAPAGPVTLPVLPMIFGQYSFTGSVIGSPLQISEMLQFAAENNIRTAVEVMPLRQVNEALDRVRRNQTRYRAVLNCQ